MTTDFIATLTQVQRSSWIAAANISVRSQECPLIVTTLNHNLAIHLWSAARDHRWYSHVVPQDSRRGLYPFSVTTSPVHSEAHNNILSPVCWRQGWPPQFSIRTNVSSTIHHGEIPIPNPLLLTYFPNFSKPNPPLRAGLHIPCKLQNTSEPFLYPATHCYFSSVSEQSLDMLAHGWYYTYVLSSGFWHFFPSSSPLESKRQVFPLKKMPAFLHTIASSSLFPSSLWWSSTPQ